MNQPFDVAIIGSGFSGSILARILASRGRHVALLDGARHPRFAIGESSTPIADLMLRRLGEQYGLPDLIQLSSYGRWRESLPTLPCGIKRGFSYFDHRAHPETPDGRETYVGQRSLVVAASPTDRASDTHWYRPAIDQYFCRAAEDAGVLVREGDAVTGLRQRTDPWVEIQTRTGQSFTARFVVDASGNSAITRATLHNGDLTDRLQTRSGSAFAHYRGVASFSSLENQRYGDQRASIPFDADAAAQHHLIDEGWVWMLRMDHGITSVGVTGADAVRGQRALADRFAGYPQLAAVMRDAEIVAPRNGITSVPRLQRLLDPIVSDSALGQRCVMMPTTAFTLDPLHSTGIAHALIGVHRVAEILLGDCSAESLCQYREALIGEAEHLDRMVSMAYTAMRSFPTFVDACMVYFAAAIACEERVLAGEIPSRFWQADDDRFCQAVIDCQQWIRQSSGQPVTDKIRRRIASWNTAGLMDPSLNNRYAYTATKV